MSKRRAIVFITSAFLVGAMLGGWTGQLKHRKLMWLDSAANDANLIKFEVGLLKKLQTNNAAKAIETLETDLDWSLVGLGNAMSNCPNSLLDQTFLRFIKEAKEYREQFPRKSDSSKLDDEVSNTFLRVSAQTKK